MKDTDFINKLLDIATNYKTLYVMGCFGSPMTATNKQRYSNNNSYNKKAERTAMIQKASADTFGFDCVCLIKGILWGWCGNKNAIYGGATYCSNGVPDIGDAAMINACNDISTDFSNIVAGEAVWMSGHIGVYIGDGYVIESSPKWKNGVQKTVCANHPMNATGNARKWTKHGKLPYVEYSMYNEDVHDAMCNVELRVLSKGCKGSDVKALQQLLIANGFSCGSSGADASLGLATDKALREYQQANDLEVDGICGNNTWSKLLK